LVDQQCGSPTLAGLKLEDFLLDAILVKKGSDLEIDMNPIFHCQNVFVVDCFGAAINFKQKVIQVAYEWSWSFVMSLPS